MALRDPDIDRSTRGFTAFLNNPRFRGIVFQIMLLIAIVGFVRFTAVNTLTNLADANRSLGYTFLDQTAGFGIIQRLIDYTEASSYGRALLVGLCNTLLVAVVGIIAATTIGVVVGIARLSSNWLIARLATAYVEILRNVPLLLQIFFWYFAVLRAVPGMREKWTFLGVFHLNIGGLHIPSPVLADGVWMVVAAIPIAIAVAIFAAEWGKQRQIDTGRRPPIGLIVLAILIVIPSIAFFIAGRPISISVPVFNETGPLLRRGFQAGSGVTVLPEFMALVLALSIYTATYIAEIVRAGVLAVNRGQTEAAHSLGLRSGQTLRLVVMPQAMRVIIPPLTNQYLNLTKNSSLAVAIAYPDLVSVGGTVLNQTNRAVEVVSIWMIFYLGLSLLTAAVMNLWNQRVALIER